MPNDIAVWEKVRAGDASAFESLFLEIGPRLRAFLGVYCGGVMDAEDLVQETFLQIWKRPDGYDPERGTLRQYLYGIARKRAAQRRRESPHVSASPGEARSASCKKYEGGTNGDLFAAMREGMLRLDADERGLLWLREVEGYSYSELGEILGVPLGTVKSRLFAARESLRQVWLNGKKS